MSTHTRVSKFNQRAVMFRIAVIVFGTILCQCFTPWMTLADISPNDANHYDNPVTRELSIRLDELTAVHAKYVTRIGDLVTRVTELEDLCAKDLPTQDVKRMEELVTRVTELEGIRAKDLRTMTRKIKDLEDGYTKDKLKLASRVMELEHLSNEDGILGTNAPQGNNTTNTDTDGQQVNAPLGVTTTNLAKRFVKNRRRFDGVPPVEDERSVNEGLSASTIAFHARLSVPVTSVWTGQAIKFNQVTTNVRSNYSPMSGVFTCTQAGIHVFSWTIRVKYMNWMYTELVQNGVAMGSLFVGDNSYSIMASATATLGLSQGDRVWVRVGLHSGEASVYDTQSFFTGFRIK